MSSHGMPRHGDRSPGLMSEEELARHIERRGAEDALTPPERKGVDGDGCRGASVRGNTSAEKPSPEPPPERSE